MAETAVKMTLEDLCRTVAEKMGWEDDGYGCLHPPGEFDPNNAAAQFDHTDLLTGDGMLEVLEWLKKQDFNMQFQAYVYLFNKLKPKGTWDVSWLDINPTAVLLAFMKAVKGVDVELEGPE